MSDSARSLLVRGIAAAKAKDVDEARFFLEWLILTECTSEQRADALFWLSEISEDVKQKRAYLDEVLGLRPNYYAAQRSLAVLDGRLDPQEIIDPNKPPAPTTDQQADVQSQRFVCPQCGGRLTYSPDGSSLTCDYCAQGRAVAGSNQETRNNLPGQDFIIAMATAKGHSHPVSTRTFECHACGAVFLLAPEMVSLTCSYCASVYVIEQAETHQLLPPESIIPFSIDESRARQIMIAWSKHQRLPANTRLEPPRGLYFPAWKFTISGPLPWNSLIPDNNDFDIPDAMDGWKTHSGMELVAQDDILVPGSQTLPENWFDNFCQYDLDQLVPYDPAYLADWPAESYQISLSDASLEARAMVLEHARSAVKDKIPAFHKNLYLDSKDLMVETFKLILLPLWISHFRVDQKHYPLLINGQTGKVWGRKAGGGVIKWFSSLFKDE